MSFLARPTVVFAIVFGCFAVLIPRVFLPIFRSKSSTTAPNYDDHFRRPPSPVIRNDPADHVEQIPGTPPHMRGAHPSMRMHHPGAHGRQPAAAEQSSSKSIVTLALPMYTVGIGVFFIYTCCKYWSKKSTDEAKAKGRHAGKDALWGKKKGKVNYDTLDQDSEDEGNKEEFYAGLDPDYVEYLKLKKQKAVEAQSAMSEEQMQMHHALEEMKKSLSFISSKLVTKESRGNLDGTEINHLQDRLASTEAQMCKILTALDAASDKVNKLTKKPAKVPASESDDSAEEDDDVLPSNEPLHDSSSEDDELEAEDPINLDDEGEGQETYERDRSLSECSNPSSDDDDDQSAPTAELNRLIRRKRH